MATIEEILTWAADGGEIPTEAALHKDLTDRTRRKDERKHPGTASIRVRRRPSTCGCRSE